MENEKLLSENKEKKIHKLLIEWETICMLGIILD